MLLVSVAVGGERSVLECGVAAVPCPQYAELTLSALEGLDEEPASPTPGSSGGA